jgi:hypothetical protein
VKPPKPKPKPARKPKAAPVPAPEPTPPVTRLVGGTPAFPNEEAKAKRPGVEYEPSEKDRRTVDSMGTWAQQKEIAKVLGISEMTLRKHFREQLDTAFLRAQDGMWRSLYRQGLGSPARKADPKRGTPASPAIPPNVQATIKWLEFRAGASARITVVDGGKEVDPKQLSDADLDREIERLRRTPAVMRAARGQGTVH